MEADDLDGAAAFADRRPLPDDSSLLVEGDALLVEGWWPAALWLGPDTCLVRVDDSPRPNLPVALQEALAERARHQVDVGLEASIQAISVGSLGQLGAEWQVWSTDIETARAAIAAAASA